MHQFDVPVDFDTHPQSKHKNKHNQTYSGFRCILHKAHLAHLLNLITLFTVSLHNWICERPSFCWYCSALYRCQNHRWRATFLWCPPFSARCGQNHLMVITLDTHTNTHISYIQPETAKLTLHLLTAKVTFALRGVCKHTATSTMNGDRSRHWVCT